MKIFGVIVCAFFALPMAVMGCMAVGFAKELWQNGKEGTRGLACVYAVGSVILLAGSSLLVYRIFSF